MYKKIPHNRFLLIKRINSDGTSTSFNETNQELWQDFLKWNAQQQNPIDLSIDSNVNSEPEDEKEFTPAERKAIRELLKKKV